MTTNTQAADPDALTDCRHAQQLRDTGMSSTTSWATS